ncbi:hypothetical protein QIS99_32025 [Streptomyces sp. B-S-A8]|uniref:Uncharacterized protein n=1 Tax=Streptomyces solicavernae TaxID=3043614 RepID=A0ABT6S264_9ACTN|nr:hypothetical protein [Streptomyces sp. B-S-A8]MDI3390783.1 hypothetical protein [Streptomyces sp. B-S-A8]
MSKTIRRISTLTAGVALAATAALGTAAPAQADVGAAGTLDCREFIQHEQKYAGATCTDVSGAHVWRVRVICGYAPDQYSNWVATRIGSTVGMGAYCPWYSNGVGGVTVEIQ